MRWIFDINDTYTNNIAYNYDVDPISTLMMVVFNILNIVICHYKNRITKILNMAFLERDWQKQYTEQVLNNCHIPNLWQ